MTPGNEKDRITQYIECVIPIFKLIYPVKLFGSITAALKRQHEGIDDLLSHAKTNGTTVEQLAAILVIDDDYHKKLKTELLELLTPNPLLKYRCGRLGNNFLNRHTIRKTLLEHESRLSWHFQRIYCTRNQIVHEGRPLPYIHTLVENLHSYLDTILKALVLCGRIMQRPADLPLVFEALSNQASGWLIYLESCKTAITPDDFSQCVFGPINSLGPSEDRFPI